MRASGRRIAAATAALACAALAIAIAPGRAPAATTNQTPFSKFPHLFFNETPPPMLAASSVVARYEHMLDTLRAPKFTEFSFSIEQVGAHILSQSHRVYRAGPNERDETVIADGYQLRKPDVRIFRNRSYRYELGAVAPRSSEYAFKLTGTQHDGDHDDYVFETTPRGSRSFAVTSVVIDGARFLPTELGFHIGAGALRGQGRLQYGLFDTYWLIRQAEVTAHGAAGATSRERIIWSAYQFPDSLPPSTFSFRAPSVDNESVPLAMPADRPTRPPSPTRTSPSGPPAGAPATAPAARPNALSKPPPPPHSATAHAHAHARPMRTPEPSDAPAEPEGTPEVLQGPVTPAAIHVAPTPVRVVPSPVPTLPPPAPVAPLAPKSATAATALPGAGGQP